MKWYTYFLGILIVFFVIYLGYFALFRGKTNSQTEPQPATNTEAENLPQSETNQEQVEIINLNFVPSRITIEKGIKVTWVNNDSTSHTVTGRGFDSKELKPGQIFEHTFQESGTFDYTCSIHPDMKGEVIVQ